MVKKLPLALCGSTAMLLSPEDSPHDRWAVCSDGPPAPTRGWELR